jgi:hypothetical protein
MKELNYNNEIKSVQFDFVDADKSHKELFQYLENSIELFPKEVFSFYRLFRPRLLLQLHQYSLGKLLLSEEILKDEVFKLTDELKPIYKEFRIEFEKPEIDASYLLGQTTLKEVNSKTAYFIQKHCHYLLNERKGLVHLGLFTPQNNLIALATFSRNDLSHLDHVLPLSINRNNSTVLSRLVVFEEAPINTATFFLSKTRKWISENFPEIKIILTYLDPNLDFNGTVYKAFNAKVLVQEVKKRYLYENGTYVTDREMIDRYGTADSCKLKKINTSREIKESILPLLPLKVFYYPVLNSSKGRTSVENQDYFSQPSNYTTTPNGSNFCKY